MIPAGSRQHWSRRYPPLLTVMLAVLVAAIVLPSSLNVPNSNPSTVLEYAPVPPEDDDPPPPQDGNLSTLSLGRSNTTSIGGQPIGAPADRGTGSRPTTKRCVGNPPRQTEDLMSPPCVPYFDGENFGDTYPGVTRDEITVLLYFDVGFYNSEQSPEAGRYYDLDAAPGPPCPKTYPTGNAGRNRCDNMQLRIARAMNRFFNNRFQTYRRRVHYWAYFSGAETAATRIADAADNIQRLRPFAVLDQATFNGGNQSYENALAQQGVLTFTSETALPNAFFGQNPSLAWGFWPDVEHWSSQYASYVCTKVWPYRVAHSGSGGVSLMNGRPRKLGLFYTTDRREPGLRAFTEQVKEKLSACGVEWAAEGTFPENGFVVDPTDNGRDQIDAALKFQNNEVTTVLYLGGIEGKFSQALAEIQYYPEIVVAGDLDNDNNVTARNQNQASWRNAWGTTFQLRMDRAEDTPGYQAYKYGNPHAPREEARYANDAYRDHFMLFQAIQVAGPRLTPESVDQGFHAIPHKASTDPYIAAFFFDPGDYSSVKDSAEVWWDPAGQAPGVSDPGCYRLVRAGTRFLAGRWPEGDDVFRDPGDPCTGYEGARRLRI